jgi:hypothetical protein
VLYIVKKAGGENTILFYTVFFSYLPWYYKQQQQRQQHNYNYNNDQQQEQEQQQQQQR